MTTKPTMELRWLKIASSKQLQQKHINIETGEAFWQNINIENQE